MFLFKAVNCHPLRTILSLCHVATNIVIGKSKNRVADASVTGSDLHASEYDISSGDSDTSSDASSGYTSKALAPTSEIEQLVDAIGLGINNLFKVSIFIRRFAPQEKRSRAATTQTFDNRADVIYVKDRYPLLSHKDPALAVRLGEANARRRQYFKYRRDHDERLSFHSIGKDSNSTAPNLVDPKGPTTSHTRSGLTQGTKPTKATTFMAEATAKLQPFDMDAVNPATSTVSFATDVAESSEEELPFPTLPKEAQMGSPFLCPYCVTVLYLKRDGLELQWRSVAVTTSFQRVR